VETLLNVDGTPTLLRIETTKEQRELSIPDFLDVIREVTHDKDYASSKMADLAYKLPESDKKAIKERVKQNKLKSGVSSKEKVVSKNQDATKKVVDSKSE